MDQQDPNMAPIAWEATPYVRPPWIRQGVKYGKQVLPQNEQKSNNSLTNEEVMQSRTEPVGASHAFPIRGVDQPSAEPTHKLNPQANNSGVEL